MTATPATAPRLQRRPFDMTKNYEFDTRDYWKKRATKRQVLIEQRNAEIKALERRLIELEDEIAALKKGKK